MMGGAIVTETIFNVPGIGTLLVPMFDGLNQYAWNDLVDGVYVDVSATSSTPI